MYTLQAFQLSVAVFCVAAVAGDFVGLSAEQLARAGRQSDDGAVQVRSEIRMWKCISKKNPKQSG